MSYTTTQLAAIEAAIATGELSVEWEGKRVVYRSIEDLIQARNQIRADLMDAGTLATEPRISYAKFSKD